MRIVMSAKTTLIQALTIVTVVLTSPVVLAQHSTVDPDAVQLLRKMTEFSGNLKGFSVSTQVTLEVLLDNGQRVDIDVSSGVVVRRPNKVFAERHGDGIGQSFYYDGETLTLYSPNQGVYATQPAPGTIEEMLDYTRESLGLIIPISDLVYRNAFAILMEGVTFAVVFGQTTINGVSCTQLAFRRPDVDFQVWVADGDKPYPCKYGVTDTSSPQLVSTVTVTDDWIFNPDVDDETFQFIPSQGAQSTTFLPYEIHSEN